MSKLKEIELDVPQDVTNFELANNGENIKVENQTTQVNKVSFLSTNGAKTVINNCNFVDKIRK